MSLAMLLLGPALQAPPSPEELARDDAPLLASPSPRNQAVDRPREVKEIVLRVPRGGRGMNVPFGFRDVEHR